MTQTPSNAATAIMKRRTDQRQRFDSADYAMALQQQQQSKRPPLRAPAPVRAHSDSFSDWVQCEAEPEPETHSTSRSQSSQTSSDPPFVPPQQVRRIRLQRFDSADWAMLLQQSKSSSTVDASTSSPTVSNTVAKLILDRHAYKTCNFVSTPIDPPPQRFLKNA